MSNTRQRISSCLEHLLFVVIFLWTSWVTISAQFASWVVPASGGEDNPFLYTLVQVGLICLPLLPLSLLWRSPRGQGVFRAWLWAAVFVLVVSPGRLWSPARSQWMLLSQVLLSLVFLGFITWRARKYIAPRARRGWNGFLPAAGAAALVAWPWLARGAPGSWLDVVLGLALGLLAGQVAATIVAGTWFRCLSLDSRGRGRDVFTGGLVIGTTLLVMLSGMSFNGAQLLLMVALPGLGWIAMGLSYAAPPGVSDSPGNVADRRPLALLAGLAVAAVLILVDTDATGLRAMDPALGIYFKSALFSLLLGWLLGVVALLARHRWGRRFNPALAGGLAGGAWVVGLVLFLVLGRPGLYGDRLFVILKSQADVSAAEDIQDLDQRRLFVYQTLVGHAGQSQAALRARLDRFGIDYRPYYLVNGMEVRGGLLTGLLLLTNPDVDRVLPSPVLRPLAIPLGISQGQEEAPTIPQWNLTNIGADRVWNELGVSGEGVVIGQSDSGVQPDHPELAGSYRGRESGNDYNWLDPWTFSTTPVDYGGHGTHTLGSVLGETVGVAPGAEWFACANLQRDVGNPALYLDCMQFMLAPYPQDGDPFKDGDPSLAADVLNNSWGCPQDTEGCDPASLRPAVQALRAAGIFVVASAGNDGPDCSTVTDPLSIYDDVLSVGAVDRIGNLAVFSSTGPVTADGSQRTKPDLVAPGVDVLSAYPGSTYSIASGTSMAGPHVAGVVALMWSANPDLKGDVQRTEDLLLETATPFTGTLGVFVPLETVDEAAGEDSPDQANNGVQLMETGGPFSAGKNCLGQTDVNLVPNNVAGYGIVNAYAAVERALALK